MNNLIEAASWDSVLQLDISTQVLGGPGGPANAQAQALLNRLAYLLTADGSNKIGFDPLGAYDPNTIGAAALQALAAIIPLGGAAGQIVMPPDGSGGYTIGFANPATFPGVVNIPGTVNATDPAAGNVGQYLSQVTLSSAAVSLTSPNPLNVVALTLPAGDWDVDGRIGFTGDATSVTYFSAGLWLTTGQMPTDDNLFSARGSATSPMAIDTRQRVPGVRVLSSTPTTVYLVAQASFSGGTVGCKAYGKVRARRVS